MGGGGNVSAIEPGVDMVKEGLNSFIYSLGDSMMNLQSNGSTNVIDRQASNGMIFNMLSYNLDPFSMPWVQQWWQTSLVFFVVIAILYICFGGAMALLQTINPSIMQRLAWLENGIGGNFRLKEWMSNVVLSLVSPFLTYFGLYAILQLSYVVTALVSEQLITSLPPTAENIVTYVFLAFTFMLLSIIMAIRSIIIVVFCASGLMIASLYILPSLKNIILHIFYYFILMVFLQPILIVISSIGVLMITSLPPALFQFTMSLYIALMCILLGVGLCFIFGFNTITRLIVVGSRLAL